MKIGLCRNHAGVHPGKQVCGDLEESREEPSFPTTTEHRATGEYAEIFMRGACSQPRARQDVASSAPSDKCRLTGVGAQLVLRGFLHWQVHHFQRDSGRLSRGLCSAAWCTHILSTEADAPQCKLHCQDLWKPLHRLFCPLCKLLPLQN